MNNKDHLESATNVIVGGVINYLLTLLLFGVTMDFAAWTTVVFIAASYCRIVIIRIYFRQRERL